MNKIISKNKVISPNKAISSSRVVSPNKDTVNIFIGDSITYGVGDNEHSGCDMF